MSSLVLKLKTKSGQNVVEGLTAASTVRDLKTKLCSLTNIGEMNLHVLSGYPPKALDLSDNEANLRNVGISSGDVLIVENKPGAKPKVISRNDVIPATRLDNDRVRPHVTDAISDFPGILMRKIVPADNSCLFTSIGFVLGGKVDPTCASYMRQIIAEEVINDGDSYSEAILGKPPRAYCDWILRPDSWGGAIELSVLSHFYGIEIAVVDTLNAIVNRFGEDRHYPQRVFLVFDGIHYDPLYMEQGDGDSIQTIFPTSDDRVLLEAEQLAREAKSSRQFTDVERFTLSCLECRVSLRGQAEAQAHARETGHTSFGEVPGAHVE
ncbi:ubiquitin thioesterase OTU1 [Schistocerca gregaria]|uniref:ubiquitin thioesterase OTU1 n=1 Tax=Schistocerca gregaria TaxID=7010 RepID=UPI00211DDDB0|nr:ubiquitin thioesterase OTU1 [Schistocerca gregaria]XP_049843018.1 ubiquitin thioesterase OTU1 [Schistocerca gregaria]